MADVKISGLPTSTVPLAGTEVLPIVQGGQTRQVSISNVTAGRPISATTIQSTVATGTAPLTVASTTEVANLRAANATSADTANQVKSNATTGVLQIAGPTAAATRVMTTPDANFTAARTDAAQTFVGAQTMSTYGAGIATFSSAGLISSTATTGTGNVMLASTIRFTDTTGNATPSISGSDPHYPATLQVSNASPYTITNILGRGTGQVLVIINRGAGAVTISRAGALLNGSTDQILLNGYCISLLFDDNIWFQIAPISLNG